MTLSDLPVDQVVIGLDVISAIGCDGKISNLFVWLGGDEDGELGIEVKWANDNISCQPQSCYGAVLIK